jgi:hypothetical protein
MNNIKALLVRGAVAAKNLEKSVKDLEENISALVKSEHTQRAVVGFVASVTPRGIEAGVQMLESLGALYEEASIKVHVLHAAMPGIARSLEAASEGEGLVPAAEIIAAGKELEEEEQAANPPKAKKNARRTVPAPTSTLANGEN